MPTVPVVSRWSRVQGQPSGCVATSLGHRSQNNQGSEGISFHAVGLPAFALLPGACRGQRATVARIQALEAAPVGQSILQTKIPHCHLSRLTEENEHLRV